jgi:hypothetical protein
MNSLSKDLILNFYSKFQKEVEITERVFQGKIYQNTFIGSQLVTWISKNSNICRKTSLRLGNQYLHLKLFSGFSSEQNLHDEFIPYQVLPLDEKIIDTWLDSIPEVVSLFLYKTESQHKSNLMKSNPKSSSKVEEKVKIFEKKGSSTMVTISVSAPIPKDPHESSPTNSPQKFQNNAKKRGSDLFNNRKSSTSSVDTQKLPSERSPHQSYRFSESKEDADSNTEESHTEKTETIRDDNDETEYDYHIEFRRTFHFDNVDEIFIPQPKRHSLPDLKKLEFVALTSENRISQLSKIKPSIATTVEKKIKTESKKIETKQMIKTISFLDTRKNSPGNSFLHKKTPSMISKNKKLMKNPIFAKTMNSLEEVTFNEGYLLQFSRNVWKKYYFEIKFNSLVIKKTKHSPNTLQIVSLTEKTEIKKEKKFCFKVVNGNSEYLFDAKNEDDFEKWMNDFTNAIEHIQRRNVNPLQNVVEAAVASDINGIILEINEKAEILLCVKRVNSLY